MIDCQAFTLLTTKDINGSITAAVNVSGILNYLNGKSVYPLSISLTHHLYRILPLCNFRILSKGDYSFSIPVFILF